jgi:hypothetical protein
LTFEAKFGIISSLGMHCIDKISTLIIASRPRLKDVKFDQKLNARNAFNAMARLFSPSAQPALAYA